MTFKTRIVRGSDYSPAIALSEDKDIFSNCDATLQKMILYNPNVDLVNDNVYTKFGLNKSVCSQDIEQKLNSDINQGPYLCCKCVKNDDLQSQRRSCQ